MTFGSLFAGIGGMDLGLERAGMECRWQVEIDPFCQKVLTKHWPKVPKYGDITKLDGSELERVDLICGGFPCQDISLQGAVWGERMGVERGERSGLWTPMRRIIRLVRPGFVIVENVSAILGNGLGIVLGQLAEIGYDTWWDCLPASAFGAAHQRDRAFVVAHDCSQRIQRGWQETIRRISPLSREQDERRTTDLRKRSDLPTPLFRGSRDGIPDWMDRLHGVGNAVYPDVAEWIGRRIMEATADTAAWAAEQARQGGEA